MMIWRHREGAVLILTIVVLAFSIIFAGAAFYLVENVFSTSANVVKSVELTGAAESGIEKGKKWLDAAIQSENSLPRFYGDGIEGEINVPADFDKLKVKHFPLAPMSGDSKVEVEVDVFDLKYAIGAIDTSELTRGKIFPPQLSERMIQYIASRYMFSSYAASNRGEGSIGAGFGIDKYGAYLVISRAVSGGKEKVLSEAVVRVLSR